MFSAIFIIPNLLFAQIETERWGKAEINYAIPMAEKEFATKPDNIFSAAVYGAQKTYKFLISDVDGDNCPFYPSCSHFYVEAVKETNPVAGTLMFFDRFTRDTNFFKNFNGYKIHSSGRFYDPVYLYKMNEAGIVINLEKENLNKF